MEELSVFKGLSGFHVNDSVCTVMASGKDAHAMLSLVGSQGVRWHCAMRLAMLSLSADGVMLVSSERLGLVWRGHCAPDGVGCCAVVSGVSTISCGGDACMRGVTLLGLKVRSWTVLQKFTLGECGRGVAVGKSMLWSLVMASKFCCPLRLVVPLRVAMRSWNAFTIASAGVTMGCVMYL